MSPEKPHGNTASESSPLQGRKSEKCISWYSSLYLLSVVKSTLWGINFLCVQVVLCSLSRQLLGQPEPLSCSAAASPHQLGLYIGTFCVRWQWLGLNHCEVFQIARSIASGCCVGWTKKGQRMMDLGWYINWVSYTAFLHQSDLLASCYNLLHLIWEQNAFSLSLRKEVQGQSFQVASFNLLNKIKRGLANQATVFFAAAGPRVTADMHQPPCLPPILVSLTLS